MPESVLLEEIVRGRELTEAQWLRVIEERAYLVRKSMDRVRLTPLGELKFIPSELGGGVKLSINDLKPREVHGIRGVELETDGIFRGVSLREWPETPGDHHCLIGLNRNGTWFDVTAVEGDSRTNSYNRFLVSVSIGVCRPERIVAKYALGYLQLFRFLSQEYEGWVQKKREQLEKMLKVKEILDRDDIILDALCDAKKVAR